MLMGPAIPSLALHGYNGQRMNDVKDETRQETMIQQQVVERGIRDERVIAALRWVPRDRFFPPGSKDEAFADRVLCAQYLGQRRS